MEDGLVAKSSFMLHLLNICLLYTSDAADERSSVDLGGRRIIKKKTNEDYHERRVKSQQHNETPNQ